MTDVHMLSAIPSYVLPLRAWRTSIAALQPLSSRLSTFSGRVTDGWEILPFQLTRSKHLSPVPYLSSRGAIPERQLLRNCNAEALGTKRNVSVNAAKSSKREEVTTPRVCSLPRDTLAMMNVQGPQRACQVTNIFQGGWNVEASSGSHRRIVSISSTSSQAASIADRVVEMEKGFLLLGLWDIGVRRLFCLLRSRQSASASLDCLIPPSILLLAQLSSQTHKTAQHLGRFNFSPMPIRTVTPQQISTTINNIGGGVIHPKNQHVMVANGRTAVLWMPAFIVIAKFGGAQTTFLAGELQRNWEEFVKKAKNLSIATLHQRM